MEKRGETMQMEERILARQQLDREQRYFQIAGKHLSFSPKWLRRVRQVLGVTVPELAQELGINRSVIFRLEESEERKTISLKAMERVARAMGCTVVYAIVPIGGKTLMEQAEWRKWSKRVLGRE
jgi:DNA-binding Xre family transcriptional regulator